MARNKWKTLSNAIIDERHHSSPQMEETPDLTVKKTDFVLTGIPGDRTPRQRTLLHASES